jgi:hypothetical protein
MKTTKEQIMLDLETHTMLEVATKLRIQPTNALQRLKTLWNLVGRKKGPLWS